MSSSNLSKCIPLEIHGDGAQSSKRQKFRIQTMISPLCLLSGIRSTLDTRLLQSCLRLMLIMFTQAKTVWIFVLVLILRINVWNAALSVQNSLEEIELWLCWSLFWCSVGVDPPVDPNGHPFSDNYLPERARLANTSLAGGFRFFISGHRGDQEYIVNAFLLIFFKRRLWYQSYLTF